MIMPMVPLWTISMFNLNLSKKMIGKKVIIRGNASGVFFGELALRKPEPYKGKGIKFVGEIIRRKSGKSANAK